MYHLLHFSDADFVCLSAGLHKYETSNRNGNGANLGEKEQNIGEASSATAVAKPQENGAALDVIKKAGKPEKKDPGDEKPDLGTFWGLLVLGLAYVHHSTSG